LLVHASIQPKNSLEHSSIIIIFLNRQILLMLTLAQEVHNELKKQSTTRQEKKKAKTQATKPYGQHAQDLQPTKNKPNQRTP
jgi:hypothetical protein